MAEEKTLIIAILLASILTYLIRALPLQISTKNWPEWIKSSLEFLPVAIISAVIIPSIVIDGYKSNFTNAEFITTIFAIIVAIYSKSLIITILLSLLFLMLVDNYLF
jgi:branched-subunit amino acid transport protein